MHTFLLLLAALASLCLVVFSYLALTSQLSISLYIFISLSIAVILLFSCEYFMQKCFYLKRSIKKSESATVKEQAAEIKTLKEQIAQLEKDLTAAKESTPAGESN